MQQRRATDADGARREADAIGARSEDLHLRNYDPHTAYDVTVRVTDTAGRTVLENRYYVQPGQRRSERRELDPGTYEVTVTLDNVRQRTVECTVGPDPERTVLVEVGNNTVSVTQGLYS